MLLLLVLATKGTKLLKVFKSLKLAKVAVTAVTASISFFAYALFLGPWFAVGLILMLLVHEYGHVWALKRRGFPASAPVFIPFLGAAIFAPKMGNRDDEAYMAYGGPLVGGLFALVMLGIWLMMPAGPWAHIVFATSLVGIYLNLFNLIPISPLDGGRITQAVGSWFKYVGVAVLAAFSAMLREPMVLLIWILVLDDFTSLTAKFRSRLAAVLLVTMAVLMGTGNSTQHFSIDIIDCVMGAFITAMIFAKARNPELEESLKDTRPELSREEKWKWLGYYGVMSIVLSGALVFMAMHMPALPR